MQLPSEVNHSKSEPKACAMILAAGRGERMRPLTDHTPKPLLAVRGKPLMQWPMEALVRSGFEHILINTAWLGERIHGQYGSLTPLPGFGVAHLRYSDEAEDFGYALETAGGIARALPQLAEVFWVVAGDVFVPDFEFKSQAVAQLSASDLLAHIWLVPNPLHNPLGDFGLSDQGLAMNWTPNADPNTQPLYTFSTIALYRRAFFELPYCDIVPGNPQGTAAPLAPLLRAAMDRGQVGATVYTGPWTDVGTPERLAQLNAV